MENWQEGLVALFQESTFAAAEVYADIAALVRLLGYEYCAYERRHPFPLGKPKLEILDNYPTHVRALYEDYFTSEILRIGQMIYWQAFDRSSALRQKPQRHFGWTISLSGSAGASATFTVLSERLIQKDRKVTALLLSLAHVAHGKLSAAIDRALAEKLTSLSMREVEVLRWTGDGKTSADIAQLLRISENTINFHLKNVKNKLLCSTKTSCVARAALLGLLS